MLFREFTELTKLKEGPFGIPIPIASKIMNPTLVLLPMIVFKSNLHRLGQGGGYYDHTISELRKK